LGSCGNDIVKVGKDNVKVGKDKGVKGSGRVKGRPQWRCEVSETSAMALRSE
jgi:hypothetical protein